MDHNITDNSLGKLLEKWEELEYLRIGNCYFLTEMSLNKIKNPEKLIALDLSGINLSSHFLINFFSKTKNLRALRIVGVKSFLEDPKVFETILENCSQLRVLDFGNLFYFFSFLFFYFLFFYFYFFFLN